MAFKFGTEFFMGHNLTIKTGGSNPSRKLETDRV